jgi:hypothetical protein
VRPSFTAARDAMIRGMARRFLPPINEALAGILRREEYEAEPLGGFAGERATPRPASAPRPAPPPPVRIPRVEDWEQERREQLAAQRRLDAERAALAREPEATEERPRSRPVVREAVDFGTRRS